MKSIAYTIVLDGRVVVAGVAGNKYGGEIDIEELALTAAVNLGLITVQQRWRAEVIVIAESEPKFMPTVQDLAFLKGCQITV